MGLQLFPPRLCCAEPAASHFKGDAWLSHLWLVWAHAAEKPQWYVARTDDRGCVLTASDEKKASRKPPPWSAGEKYLLHLIRSPDRSLADAVLARKNAQDGSDGEPLELEGTVKPSGKEKFLVFSVPESPDSFLPRGSALTLGYSLFRHMPCDHCAPVRKAVRRLQYALGAMRYLVGPQTHPYTPEEDDKNERNAGEFDVMTWNSVLLFQRHQNGEGGVPAPPQAFARHFRAAAGKEADLRTAIERIAGAYVDPPIDIGAPVDESNFPADAEVQALLDAQAAPPEAHIREDAVVDEATGRALEASIAKKLRKPGAVLVAMPPIEGANPNLWGREDLVRALLDWNEKLRALGWKQGAPASHTYRNATANMTPKFGADKKSIHKSGFAVDLRNADHAGPREEFKVILVRVQGDRPRFELWGEVAQPDTSGANAAYFADTVESFTYSPKDPDGGATVTLDGTKTGVKYLHITKVGEDCGFHPIRGFPRGCFFIKGATCTLSADSLPDFVTRLWALNKQLDAKDPRKAAVQNDLSVLQKWTAALVAHGRRELNVWLDPRGSKADAKFRDLLLKSMKGCSFTAGIFDADESFDFTKVESSIELSRAAPQLQDFVTLQPETQFIQYKPGAAQEFPDYQGDASGLEWWHFQLTGKLAGKKWSELLQEIGWTLEGLGKKPFQYGEAGLGFSEDELAAMAG